MLSGEQFRRISTIVLDANPDACGFDVLREQLVDLLINVGAADDGTKFGGWFRQEANKRISHKALARQFAATVSPFGATASRPSSSTVCGIT